MLIHSQMGFLENFVKVFPNLATRPLHITGESYAGMYIVSVVFSYNLSGACNILSALHHQKVLRDG